MQWRLAVARYTAGPRPRAGALVGLVLRDGPGSVASSYTDYKLVLYKCKAHIDDVQGRLR